MLCEIIAVGSAGVSVVLGIIVSAQQRMIERGFKREDEWAKNFDRLMKRRSRMNPPPGAHP